MGKPSREKERPLKLPPISGVGKNRISYVDESLNLTDAQFKAFQEAFELFDKNGGGTIDAAELQKTLTDCGICVNGDDLAEIMLTLDHDGNGEVDFEEFLNLMTNTDIFIEAVGIGEESNQNEEMKKRLVLFDALTEFLKNQALKGGNEIINYFSKKYKKVVRNYGNGNKGAHVVGHYADVARLVGLTERELYAQLKELKLHANTNESSSPYAQSFHLGLLKSVEMDRQRISPCKPYKLGGPRHRREKKQPTKSSPGLQRNRVTLRIIGLDRMETIPQEQTTVYFNDEQNEKNLTFSQMKDRRKSLQKAQNGSDYPTTHRPGWTSQPFSIINVDIRIPKGWSIVPLSQLRPLKRLTKLHSEAFFTKVACEKLSSNLKFYRSLNTRKPRSDSLYTRVKECMVSYSAATTNDAVGKVGPNSLNRIFSSDNDKDLRRKSLKKKISRSVIECASKNVSEVFH